VTALDTNVLLRFLIWDDEVQAHRAKRIVDRAYAESETLFLSDVVLVEAAWVLARSYRQTRRELLAILRSVLDSDILTFESLQRFSRTLDAFEQGPGDFADYLLRERALEAGCKSVVTFDRRLKGQQGFRVL